MDGKAGEPRFELLEHTADTGIRAYGKTLEDVFANCALGMISIILEPERVHPREEVEIEAGGRDLESTLVAWLEEILFLVEGEGMAFRGFEVEKVEDDSVKGKGRGEPLDPSRHEIKGEIKAPTYHRIRVARERDGWTAQVIFDV